MILFTKEELEKKIRFNKFIETMSYILIGIFTVISLIHNTNLSIMPYIIFFGLNLDSSTRIRMYEFELKRLTK